MTGQVAHSTLTNYQRSLTHQWWPSSANIWELPLCQRVVSTAESRIATFMVSTECLAYFWQADNQKHSQNRLTLPNHTHFVERTAMTSCTYLPKPASWRVVPWKTRQLCFDRSAVMPVPYKILVQFRFSLMPAKLWTRPRCMSVWLSTHQRIVFLCRVFMHSD